MTTIKPNRLGILNVIINFLKYKEQPKPLGRWQHNIDKHQNRKVDLTNEDHCGCCNQYNEGRKTKK
jgi:hypothetical protein